MYVCSAPEVPILVITQSDWLPFLKVLTALFAWVIMYVLARLFWALAIHMSIRKQAFRFEAFKVLSKEVADFGGVPFLGRMYVPETDGPIPHHGFESIFRSIVERWRVHI
jgi:hypothetical protein